MALRYFGKLYWGGFVVLAALAGYFALFQPDSMKEVDWWVPLIGLLLAVALVYIFQRTFRSTVPDWIALTNQSIEEARVYGSITEEPRLEIVGTHPLSEDEVKKASRLRFKINDLHAMVEDEPLLLQSPVEFKATTLKYSELEVLRENDRQQFILSASVVVVCPSRRGLILHHRSADSRTYPDSIHTIGGAYQPSADSYSLRRTAHREVYEEIGASVLVDDRPPMILALEKPTRFLQLAFLGAQIPKKQYDNSRSNWEGQGLIRVSYDELRKLLTEPIRRSDSTGSVRTLEWVPSGKAHILAWLALGAPGAGHRPSFGGVSPQALFKEVVRSNQPT